VGLIWFDTPEGISREQSQAIAGLVRGIQPGCLLNGRLFPKRQAADYGSAPDNQGPVQVVNEPWELPATIARGTWGYRKDQVYRSLDELIFELVDVVSKGGNLLLNIGPRPDGSIPEADVERLRGMGRWLAVNGEAVYGTDATPFGTELSHRSWRCTRKANRLFVHVFAPPAKREWVLDTGRPALAARVTRARLLAPPGTVLPFACDAGRLTIRLPANMADSFPAVVALDLEKEAEP
jgi:alpha-L-fucosidase